MYRTNTTTGASQELVLVSPTTDNLGNGTKQLRFSVRSYSTTTYVNKLEILSMPDPTTTTGATVLATVNNSNTNGQAWKEYIIALPPTTDDYFAFRLAYNGTTTASSIILDDIHYENLSPCMFPGNITASNITENTATISWDPSLATGVTGYEYEVRSSGSPGSGTIGLEVSGTTVNTFVNITGLDPATEYLVYIRSVCGTTPGVWTTFPADFMTACPVYTGFYEDFDSTPVGSTSNPVIPHCWSFIDDVVSSGYLYNYGLSTGGPQSAPNYIRMYRTNNTGNSLEELVLISPPTDSLGNGTKQVRFSARSYSTTNYVNQLEILSMPSNTSTAGATVLATVSPSTSTYEEYVVPLPVTTDEYFGFRLAYNGVTTASSVSIDDVYYEEIPAPTIDTITFVDNACFIDTSGSATVEVVGGVPPLTYEWLPSGGTSSTADSLSAGIYTVTVTDAKNRSVTDTVTISSPDEILIDFEYENVSCNGQTDGWASVNPSGGVGPYSVLWSTNDTTDTISNLIAGTYTVTITDANDCEITEDFDIIEPDVLTASVSAQNDVTVSGGNDGSATITATGGTAPYTYSWSPSGGTSDTATGLTAGTYTVDITDDSGCTTDVTVVITEPMPLTITLVSQTNVSCNGGNDGEIIIDVVGDHPPFTYLWSPATGNSSTVSNLIAGTYTVTVTDTLGAFETATYTIDEPTAISLSVGAITNVTCNGGSNGSATAAVSGGTRSE